MSERLRLLYDLSVKYEVPGISTYNKFLQSLKDTPEAPETLYRLLSGKHNVSLGTTFESFATQIQPDITALPDVIENVPPLHKSPPIEVPGVFDTQTVEPEKTAIQQPIDPDVDVTTPAPATAVQRPVPVEEIVSDQPLVPEIVSPAKGLPVPRSRPDVEQHYSLQELQTEIKEPVGEIFEGFVNTYQRIKHQDELGKQLQESLYKGDIDWKEHRELWGQYKYTYDEMVEPLMTALAPTPTEGIVDPLVTMPVNVAKELTTLAVIQPHIAASLMNDVLTGNYTKTIKSIKDFYVDVYGNWINALGANPSLSPRQSRKQQKEAMQKIANQPIFHAMGLFLPVGLMQKMKIPIEGPNITNIVHVKTMPRNLEKFVADTKAAEIVDFAIQHPEGTVKIITKATEQLQQGNLPPIEPFVVMPKNPREAAHATAQPNVVDVVTQIPRNFKEVKTPGAERMETHFELADIEASSLGKPTFNKVKEKLVTSTVDIAGNVKKQLLEQAGDIGKRAVIYKDTIAGSSARATYLSKQYSDRVYGGLTKLERKALDNIIRSRRVTAIESYKPDYNPGAGVKRGDAKQYLDYMPKNLTDKLTIRAETYFEIMRSELGRLVKEGVITPQGYEKLLKYEYEPTIWLDKINPEITYQIGGATTTLRESGIKTLKEGLDALPVNDSQLLLERTVTITDARIANNRANKALYNIANQVPGNNIVLKAETIHPGTKQYRPPPPGYTNMPVRIGGEVKEFYMRNDMAREWLASSQRAEISNALGWVSGSNFLKPMATGFNPEFALTNFPRDLAHIYLTTKEYSSFAPKFLGEIGRDLLTVAGDVMKRKGRYADYVMEGGGMNFLTHQGIKPITESKFALRVPDIAIGTKTIKPLESLSKVFGHIGETAEIWTRLALRERALRNGKSNIEATWIARNYLDFSQGGSMIKAADVGIPYLNAGIQGTRGIIRAFKNDPALATWKAAQIGALSSGLFTANRNVNPDAYELISSRQKVSNWIITTPYYEIDEDGEKRYFYLSIPKDHGQRLIATTFEALISKHIYKEDPPEELFEMAKSEAIPFNYTTLPPTLDAVLGYTFNKDFWRNEDIWKGREFPEEQKGLEYTPKTHPFFVKVGEKIPSVSPVRMKYMLEQWATSGNIYTDVVGSATKALFDELPDKKRDGIMKDLIDKKMFVRKYWKTTPKRSAYLQLEKATKDHNAKTEIQNREFDQLFDRYANDLVTGKAMREHINQYEDRQTQERLRRRYNQARKYKNVPNRRYWMSYIYSDATPEVKAKIYIQDFIKLSEEDRAIYEAERKQFRDGVLTGSRFNREFKRLKKKFIP